jgi:hypothetical protein
VCAAAKEPGLPDGFLRYPPYNAFDFEAVQLLPAPHDGLTDVELKDFDMKYVGESVPWTPPSDSERKRTQADYDGVSPNLRPEIQAMRTAPNGDAAYAAGKDLPASIRLYIAGAMDFHLVHPNVISSTQGVSPYEPQPPTSTKMDAEQREALDHAISRFEAVLNLPDAQKSFRGVDAAYMLGRSLALRGSPGDEAKAENAFMLSRTLARRGMRDPLGLAVSSFGEQARLRRAQGDIPSAVELYAEQASYQSTQGVASLKWVAQALYGDPTSMSKAEFQPLVQRVLVDYALAINDNGVLSTLTYTNYTDPVRGHPASPELYNVAGIAPILAAAKNWPLSDVAARDHLAALAYRVNDLAFARKLLVGQNSALAWWLRAKLDLADGNPAAAEQSLLAARKLTASDTFESNASGLSSFNIGGMCQELTQLERARGEFQLALSNILACERQGMYVDNIGEENYLANGVLTTPELIAFVNSHTYTKEEKPKDGWGNELRSLLAMRLVREGRLHEALQYANSQGPVYTDSASLDGPEKPRSQRQLLQEYVDAQDHIRNSASRIKRAQAWYTVAVLTRVHYDAIYEGDPYVGSEVLPAYPFPGVSRAEKARVKALNRKHYLHDTHWYVGYDDALKAAQLVPPRSQAYIAILCHAAHWMHQAPAVGGHDPAAAFAYTYRLYIKNGAYVPWANKFGQVCPQPDFQSAARLGWKKSISL